MADATTYKIGDVVQRLGGGPTMTVTELIARPYGPALRCTWQEYGRAETGNFKAAELREAAPAT